MKQVEQCRQLRFDQPKLAIEVCNQAYQHLRADASQTLLSFEMLSHRGDSELSIGETERARSTFAELAQIPLAPEQWKYRYRLLRRQAQLAFRTEQLLQASGYFQSALNLAQVHEDQKFLSISHSDIGMTARRLGDYRQALKSYTESLQIQAQLPNPDLAPILNNIGDLYKDLQQYADAENRYEEALAHYRKQAKTLQIAHTIERLALVAEARGDLPRAATMLQLANEAFLRADASQDALRVRADQIRVSLDAGELATARRMAEAIPADQQQQPARLVVQLARLSRLSGLAKTSLPSLLALKERLDQTDQYYGQVVAEVAAHYSALGDAPRAAEHYESALAMQRSFALKNFRSDFAALRVALEVQENERVSAQAALDLARAETRLANERLARRSAWFASVLLVVAALALWLWERQRRARLAAAAQRRYQVAMEQLKQQTDLQSELLELQASPVALVDARGEITASNQAFDALAAREQSDAQGNIAALFPATKVAWAQALGKADESEQPQLLELIASQGEEAPKFARIRAMAVAQRGFLIDFPESEQLVAVHTTIGQDALTSTAEEPTSSTSDRVDANDSDTGQQFWDLPGHRHALVQLMLSALAAFERATGKTRIELAEQSKLWRVTVDDGRLRVRAMERYLAVAKLPKQPRWREVMRTAYFVLAHCQLANQIRTDIEAQLQQIEAALRSNALTEVD